MQQLIGDTTIKQSFSDLIRESSFFLDLPVKLEDDKWDTLEDEKWDTPEDENNY